MMIDFPDPFDKVGSALVRTGDYDPKITFGADGLADPALPELAGDEVTEGMRATVAGSIEGGPGEAFAQLYDGAGGVGRGPYDGQNFDNVILCYLAAVAAGSTEGAEMAAALPDVTNAPGDQYTWEELPEAIEALQNGDDIDYQGVTGDVELDDAGDPAERCLRRLRVRGGRVRAGRHLRLRRQGRWRRGVTPARVLRPLDWRKRPGASALPAVSRSAQRAGARRSALPPPRYSSATFGSASSSGPAPSKRFAPRSST